MKNVRANVRSWVTGITTAALGITLARVLAPQFAGPSRLLLTVGGQVIALAGLLIICMGVRRRVRQTDSTPARSS